MTVYFYKFFPTSTETNLGLFHKGCTSDRFCSGHIEAPARYPILQVLSYFRFTGIFYFCSVYSAGTDSISPSPWK